MIYYCVINILSSQVCITIDGLYDTILTLDHEYSNIEGTATEIKDQAFSFLFCFFSMFCCKSQGCGSRLIQNRHAIETSNLGCDSCWLLLTVIKIRWHSYDAFSNRLIKLILGCHLDLLQDLCLYLFRVQILVRIFVSATTYSNHWALWLIWLSHDRKWPTLLFIYNLRIIVSTADHSLSVKDCRVQVSDSRCHCCFSDKDVSLTVAHDWWSCRFPSFCILKLFNSSIFPDASCSKCCS